MCAQGTCSDESLTAVVTNVTTGCSEDLAGIGFSVSQDDIASTIMPLVQKVYPVAREVSCLKNDTTNQLCAVQTITDLESIVGTLSTSDFSFLNLMNDVEQLVAAGADDLACTGCVQEAFSIARDAFPDIVANADSTVSGVCGEDFLAGSSASEGVSQTAVDGVFAATSQNDTNGGSTWHAISGPILAPVSIVAYFLL
ncbi:hypothetical protein CYLTODRAFT_397637 [Cylindrobasidium torrendii FP15055 ss-10]|uniref:Uncharacterized protein n=1 Tax=Cylindrobasidium torrendii FP15055 ss-10 TaxID=1314674 RepID=A0A0D7B9F7_9AGAR|nr:hypothetical protein CYLTODRAFT_397637 [Cylindrobasidium torrendii FP15055 ss-10]